MKVWEDNCKKEFSMSCYNIGILLMEPEFYNPKRAEEYLITGCEKNHQTCCFNLAVMYKKGEEGVPKDLEKSKLFQDKYHSLVKLHGKMR